MLHLLLTLKMEELLSNESNFSTVAVLSDNGVSVLQRRSHVYLKQQVLYVARDTYPTVECNLYCEALLIGM